MRATVLCYNLKGTTKGRKIGMIFGFLGYKVRYVEKEEYMFSIGDVAEGQTEGKKPESSQKDQRQIDLFSDEMLVMCPENEQMLDQALMRMRKEKVQIPYKAVLTETNRKWDSVTLYDEIKKEHERMTGKN